MPSLRLVEDRPTPKSVYNWRVYALAATASFASCMIGYDSAFIGTTLALPSFRTEFGFDHMSKSESNLISANIVSLYQAGAFFGAWAGYAGGFFLGRRVGLIVFAALFLLGAGIMLAASASVGLGPIYAGRVIAGFAIGGSSNLVPIYIAELAPPAIRGRLVGIYELGWQTGGLVGFWISYGVSKTLAPSRSQWLIPFGVQLIPGGLLLLGAALLMRESPRWLLSKGKRQRALANLTWIRQLEADHVYLVEEVAMIDADLETIRSTIGTGFWAPFGTMLSNRKIQWRLFVGTTLFLWQNACGINAINYYSPTVFDSLGIKGTNAAFFTTGLYGVVKTVVTMIWLLFLIDRVGRRNLLLVGALGGSICMWIIGAFVKLNPPDMSRDSLNSEGVAAVFFFYLWTVFYTPTWNGTPWVLNSEMFDINMRALGQAFAAASNWFWNFIISRFTPSMFTTMKYGVYFFFSSLMLFSILFVYFFVPETRSVPLESMDRLFEIRPARKANSVVLKEIRQDGEVFRRSIDHGSNSDILGSERKDDNSAYGVEEVKRHV